MNFFKKIFEGSSTKSSSHDEEKSKKDKAYREEYNKAIYRLMANDNQICQQLIADAEQKLETDEIDLSRHALKKIPAYFYSDANLKATIKSLKLDFNRFEETLDLLGMYFTKTVFNSYARFIFFT